MGRWERRDGRDQHNPGRGRPRGSTSGSELNAANIQYIVGLLRNASREEVCGILDQIGFRYSTAPPKPSPDQLEAAVAAEVRKYLSTQAGRAELDRRRGELVEGEATHYLSTTEGRKRVEKTFAQLAAGQISDNDDLLNRLCHEAAQREAEAWLTSHRGQETVSRLVEQAIDEQILEWAKLDRAGWIQRKLRELKRGEGGA